jgi:ABC-type nickel/cobalt efflux system permease component RcnA
MRFLGFVFAVAAMLAATKASAAPEEIGFSDLADPLAVVFDDPYRDMGFQLLNELKLVIQLDEKLSQDDFPEDERARLEARRTAARDMLEINGHDVDELISQRWEVAKKRKAALMATNPALDKVEVTLSGYLIPAPQAADGTYYGYLVSQVGMCSHLPPPPPNELVRVKLKDDPQGQSLYVPVRVSGLLRAEASDATIFILDGDSRMLSGWTLDANTVDQLESLGEENAVNPFHQTFTNGVDLAPSPEKVQPITWRNLVPQVEIDNDPFLELTSDQKLDLVVASRIRELKAAGVDITPEQTQKFNDAVKRLEEAQIDMDGLIDLRGEIVAQRTHAMAAVNGTLNGRQVRLAGYVLPLGTGGQKITEFLLVPWVGACIHTPPPPPNQMIHITVPNGMEPRGQFSPVWIEGKIEVKPASYDLFLVDGSMEVEVAYAMATDAISDYSAAESDDLAKVEIPESAFEGHSWFQTVQAKASLIFTKAMSGLRDDGSSKAFWFAILVAFGYGLVHTLGPGHGKAVVVSYFVGDGGSFRKGIAMGVMIAITHVLSSIIVVLVMDFAVRQATGQAPSDYRVIRLGSYALIIVIGAVMLRSAIQALRNSRKAEHSHAGHDHHHEHHDCLACSALEKKKKGAGTWLALAVGVVPCTGALLVLLFGVANDLLFPAILMVAAISTGMALAMSGIGVLAILGRRVAFRRMKDDEVRSARFTSGLRIAGAALVLMIGTLLFGLTYSNSRQLALPVQPSGLSAAPSQNAE